ncbi:hypothetical protein Tco_0935218 [Tanacetum coccineum]
MELENTQNNALAKLPMLKLRENSWVLIPVTTPSKIGTSTATKMTMPSTIEEKTAPRSKDNKNWNQGSSTKTVKIEDASEKAMCAIDGVGFDWSNMTEEEIQANMALMAFSDSEDYLGLSLKRLNKKMRGLILRSQSLINLLKALKEGLEEFKEPEVNEYGPRDSSLKSTTGCDKKSENSKKNTDDSLEQHQMTDTQTSSFESPLKNNDAPIIEDWVSDDEDEVETIVMVKKKTVILTAAKIEKQVRKPVRYVKKKRIK